MFPKDTRFLVVDDSSTMRMTIKKALNTLGYMDITEADDGETAWEIIKKAAETWSMFDIIISDWNMPKMKGIELLKLIRSNKPIAHIPVILLTAEGEAKSIQEAILARCNDYIIKPFSFQTFREKMEKLYKSLNPK